MSRHSDPLLVLSPLLISALAACDVNIGSDVMSTEPIERTIQVTGSGSVAGEPDLATLDLGVAVERETVADAREAAASAMTAVLNSLQENQIAEEDIQTGNLGIHPLYDYGEGDRTLRGYMVNNTVRVKVRRLEILSEVIDDAADAGGNSIVINSIRFMIDDTTQPADSGPQAGGEGCRGEGADPGGNKRRNAGGTALHHGEHLVPGAAEPLPG